MTNPDTPFGRLSMAVDQHVQGVTGDQHSPWTRAANAPGEMLAVGQRWAAGVGQAHEAWSNINAPATPGGPPPTAGQKTARVIRAVQQTAGAVMGGLGLVKDAIDVGFANLTAPLAAIAPSLPAATVMSPYIGTPHAHVAHPPSGPPPIPPTPLPSIGMALLGVSTRVLINSMPAARVDDIGLAPTCCGLPPAWFKLKTGSSNVYIGGNRAARIGDICKACPMIPEVPSIPAGKVMAAIGKVAGAVAKAMPALGVGMGALGMAADITESAVEDDAALAAGKAIAAATAAAQMAMDAAKMAAENLMWKDMPVLPPTGSIGAIVDPSHMTVLIGGFPMIHIPDPVGALLNRLSRYKASAPPSNAGCGKEGEPVDVVTGANLEDSLDLPIHPALGVVWRRYYDSSNSSVPGPLGWGWRHALEDELRLDLDGLLYVPCTGRIVPFPPLDHDGASAFSDGLTLRRVDAATYRMLRAGAPTLEFVVSPGTATGRLTRAFGALGEVRLGYDQEGRLAGFTAAGRRPIDVEYDTRGLIVGLSEWVDSWSRSRIVSYEYDEIGNLIAWTDARGYHATLEYDAAHRLTRKGDRRGYSYYYAYDAQGRCVHTSGEDGMYNVRLDYLDGVRCTQATHADGAVWTYFYDESGTITRIVDPYGKPRERVVDETGKVVTERDAAGNEYRILYDDAGGTVGRQDPFGHVSGDLADRRRHNHLALTAPSTVLEWEHGTLLRPRDVLSVAPPVAAVARDALDRTVAERVAGDAVRRWTHDGNGNVVRYDDADGSVQQFEYASWNLLHREADPLGNVTQYAYTARERVTHVVDPGGTTTEYGYDLRDNVVRVTRHGRVREEYVRDATDNLIEKRDSERRTLLSFEIGPGNLTSVRRLASGDTHSFEYDKAARLTKAATTAHETKFEYGFGRRPMADLRDGRGVRHHVEGARRQCVVLDRFETRYACDGDTLTVTDPTGARHTIGVRPDGTITLSFAHDVTETRRYDSAGRCRAKLRGRLDSRRPWTREYFYSAEGDLLAAHDSVAGRSRYAYDAAHRLVGEVRPDGHRVDYAYDVAGNLLTKRGLTGVTIGSGNRLAAANGDTFEYDDRDHIATRIGAAGGTRFEYDSCDRLVRCQTPRGEWRSVYDPLGRRITKTWRGMTTEYYWDHHRLAAERGPGGEVRIYVYLDADALVPFMFVDYDSDVAPTASGRSYFVCTDQIGAPIRVEDELGQAVWEAHVDPYGVTDVRPGNTIEFALRFPGHYDDAEIGLFYNRFRHYSPSLGRYLQSDPFGIAGGHNLYAYPANPLITVDLFGLHPPPGEGEEGAKTTGPDEEEPTPPSRPAPPPPPDDDEMWKKVYQATTNRQTTEGAIDPTTGQVVIGKSGGGEVPPVIAPHIPPENLVPGGGDPRGKCGMPRAVQGVADANGGELPPGPVRVTQGGFRTRGDQVTPENPNGIVYKAPCENCQHIQGSHPQIENSGLPPGVPAGLAPGEEVPFIPPPGWGS